MRAGMTLGEGFLKNILGRATKLSEPVSSKCPQYNTTRIAHA
jgi:hypothetical protein